MPASPGTRRMNPTVPQRWVHIRNAEGEHVMTTIDGEVVDGGEPDMKLIESDRSDGPNDRTDGPDGSDDGA